MKDDLINRQNAIDAHCELCGDRGRCNCDICPDMEVFRLLPSVQPKSFNDKLKEIVDALSEKMCYMNTCLNERDIILGYLGVKRPNVCHCNTDCNNYRCESYHYDAKKYLELSDDTISRRAAIDAVSRGCQEWRGIFAECEKNLNELPSAQPERLTDDDFETIRIHLSIYKEKLCNQCRWKEAEEYQKIIDRFMSFASAQPEIIQCKDCKHYRQYNDQDDLCVYTMTSVEADDYCSYAERREDVERKNNV